VLVVFAYRVAAETATRTRVYCKYTHSATDGTPSPLRANIM
jgi:hypothetical protein